MAMPVSTLLAMYLSGLNGSCFGSVKTHGTGILTASTGAASAARQTSAVHNQACAEAWRVRDRKEEGMAEAKDGAAAAYPCAMLKM